MYSRASQGQTGVQYIYLGDGITFDANTPSSSAIKMSNSDSAGDPLEITLAFVANVSIGSPTLNIISNQSGDLYYIVLLASDAAPEPEDVIAGGIGGPTGVSAGLLAIVPMSTLDAMTEYKVYVVVVDGLDPTLNSGVTDLSINGTDTDTTVPTLSPITASAISGTGATLEFTTSEDGDSYYVVMSASDTGPVKASAVIEIGQATSHKAGANSLAITGLDDNSSYTAYVVLVDLTGNKSIIYTVTFETTKTSTKKTVVIPINEEIQYNERTAANIWQLQLSIQSVENISAFGLSVPQGASSNIDQKMQLADIFIDQLIREKGIDDLVKLASVSKNLDKIEFSNMFEKIYGQSVIRWYVQRAVPKVLSEFESIDPSAHLRGLITLGLPRTVATPAQSLEKEKEKEVLQKSLNEMLQDSLIAYGGITKLELFLELINSRSYKSRPLAAFRLIYGYSFQEWYRNVGKFDFGTNLGLRDPRSPKLKVNNYSVNIKQPETP